VILLDRQFGLTAVEVEHYFNERVELGFELATNLRAMVRDLYNIGSSMLKR